MKKHSQLHKSFIMKYLFWNRIQEITKVFATKVWSYMVCSYTISYTSSNGATQFVIATDTSYNRCNTITS